MMPLVSSSLSVSASFFPAQGSIFHPFLPSNDVAPVMPPKVISSRTLLGRLFSLVTSASNPPPP